MIVSLLFISMFLQKGVACPPMSPINPQPSNEWTSD
jgi:hypothetical protein